MQQQYKESPNHTFFIAFHLTERAGQTTALENKIGFFQEVLLKNLLLYVYCLGFDWSGWIVLFRNKFLISTVLVWPISSDKMESAPGKTVHATKVVRMLHETKRVNQTLTTQNNSRGYLADIQQQVLTW